MPRSAYDEQSSAARNLFRTRERDVAEEIDESVLNMYGGLAEGGGLSGSNIARLRRGEAKARESGIGAIRAEERMFFANIARQEQARKAQSTRNLWTTIGTVGGMGLAAILAPVTGGGSFAAFPALASILGGVGGGIGGLAGGAATGEYEGGLASLMMEGAGAAESYQFRQQLAKVRGELGLLPTEDWFRAPAGAMEPMMEDSGLPRYG